MRLDDVQGVAAAGVVGVAPHVRLEAVVAAVVDALEGERRAQLARLGGVVVDHVEDDLDPRRVQRAHHPLELADLLPRRPRGRVRRMRGEVADGVVAPVVAQAPAQQMVLVRELVHGQQLHRRHAEPREVREGRRVRQPRVRAAQLGRDLRVQLGEAAYVQLVQDGVRPGGLGPVVVGPVVAVVDDDALGDVRRGVPLVAHGVGDMLLGPVPYVPVDLRRQRELPVHRAGVGVEEQLGRVPAGAGPRVPAAVHPVAVALPGADAGHEPVPDLVRQLGQRNPGLPAPFIEQAQLDRLRPARPQREVGAHGAVRAGAEPRAERGRRPRPHRWRGRLARGAVQHGVPAARVPRRSLYCLLLGCARHR